MNIPKIDKYNLDEEVIQQIVLVEEVTSEYAKAIQIRDSLDFEVKKLYANLDYEVRKQAKEKNVKVTEKEIENCVITTPSYNILYNDYLKAKYDVVSLSGKQETILQRKSMLERLVELYRMGYFADIKPKETKEISKDYIRKKINEE